MKKKKEKRYNYNRKRIMYWSYFVFMFLISSAYFSYLSIYKLENLWTKGRPLLNFYLLHFFYIKNIKTYFIISGVAIILTFSYLYFKFLLKNSFSIKKYSVLLIDSLLVIFISFNFAFIGSHAFSLGEIAIVEYKISHNPQSNNLLWDNKLISQKLDNTVIIPNIIIAKENLSKQIAHDIITEKRKKSDFYNKIILKNALDIYPINFLIPDKSSIVMFENNLYIRNFEGDSFQSVSPSLGKLLVRNEFGSRSNKETPYIEVLEKEDYQNFRIHQINTRIRKLSLLIDSIRAVIEYEEDKMSEAQGNINYYKRLANSAYSEGDSAFYRCSTAETCSYRYVPGYCGYYYCTSGYTVKNCEPMFSYYHCANLRDSYYNTGHQYTSTANYWVEQYNYHVALFNEYIEFEEEVTYAKSTAEESKESVPFELGMFEPENSIKIALSSTEPRNTSKYLSVLIHEYLHYDSHISGDKSLPLFFEEGLTEYFSRKTQENSLGYNVNLGYPVIAKLIERIVEKIPEQDLADVYFSKDTEKLQSLLDKNFGEDFYEDNILYFNLIPNIPPELALEIGNGILEKLEINKIEYNEINQVNFSKKFK